MPREYRTWNFQLERHGTHGWQWLAPPADGKSEPHVIRTGQKGRGMYLRQRGGTYHEIVHPEDLDLGQYEILQMLEWLRMRYIEEISAYEFANNSARAIEARYGGRS